VDTLRRSKPQQLFGLLGWLAASFCAAAVGAAASTNAGVFYSQLEQPNWAPPAFVFGPVWTLLYCLIGCSAWLLWRDGGFSAHPKALSLFILQLLVNALWSWLFFFLHHGALAFVDVLLLCLLVLATMLTFWRHHALAGVLLLPYLAWVSFAALLNYVLWRQNPGVLG